MRIDDHATPGPPADGIARRHALIRLRRRQLLDRRESAMRAATVAALVAAPAGLGPR
jgi:hypothetical protein